MSEADTPGKPLRSLHGDRAAQQRSPLRDPDLIADLVRLVDEVTSNGEHAAEAGVQLSLLIKHLQFQQGGYSPDVPVIEHSAGDKSHIYLGGDVYGAPQVYTAGDFAPADLLASVRHHTSRASTMTFRQLLIPAASIVMVLLIGLGISVRWAMFGQVDTRTSAILSLIMAVVAAIVGSIVSYELTRPRSANARRANARRAADLVWSEVDSSRNTSNQPPSRS